jgi:hypothetical protein
LYVAYLLFKYVVLLDDFDAVVVWRQYMRIVLLVYNFCPFRGVQRRHAVFAGCMVDD